jgi:hypothetical protein
MWINPKTLEVAVNNMQVRELRPGWSAPLIPTDEMVLAQGFVPVKEVAPVYDPITQEVAEATPKMINGVWTQQWKVATLGGAESSANLQAAIVTKNAEINAARLRANATSFTYANKQIAVDTVSFNDILATNGYIALFGEFPADWPGGWKAVDNTYLQIATVGQWKDFFKAMFSQGAANFKRAQEMKAQLAAATNGAQVAAIQWSAP